MAVNWLSVDDPWLTTRMRHMATIAEWEGIIGAGVAAAMDRFLRVAAAAVLGLPTPPLVVDALTAAADEPPPPEEVPPPPPPDLNQWPPDAVWIDLLHRYVMQHVGALFDLEFEAAVHGALLSSEPWRQYHLDIVESRLKLWPEEAWDDIRFELQEGIAAGEGHEQLRARVGAVLNINARSRALQGQIDDLTRVIDDPDTTDAERRAARSRRAELYRSKDVEDYRWQWQAARIARTETVGAFNAGTYYGAQAYEVDSGELQFKQWWSTTDSRVRPSHWAAHMQVRPLREFFSVGGNALDFPGDPGGPGKEVINCRCALLILNEFQALDEADRYNAERGLRRDVNGNLLDDDGNPIPEPLVAAGAPQENTMADTDGSTAVTLADGDPAATAATGLPVGWRGLLVPYDVSSGDDRIVGRPEGGTARVRPLPIAFKYQDRSAYGHDDAVVAGVITKTWEDTAGLWGSGPFDLADPSGAEAARKTAEGFAGWVSVDLDDVEVRYAFVDADGNEVPVDEAVTEDEDGWPMLAEGIREMEIAADWRLMGATLVADQAFPEAKVFAVYDPAEIVPAADLNAALEQAGGPHATVVAGGALAVDRALTAVEIAAAVPLHPPAEWFEPLVTDEPVPLTILDSGRVFGHVAAEGCHIGFPGRCVPVPRGASFDRFNTGGGSTRLAEGYDISTGVIVAGTDHASTHPSVTVQAAMEHYAHTGYGVARVRAGEDAHGWVWVAGALMPGVTPEQIETMRARTLSGDWREENLRVTFVAPLVVNVGGFSIARKTTGPDGRLLALTAAGMLYRRRPRPAAAPAGIALSVPDLAEMLGRELDARAGRARVAAGLAARVQGPLVAALAARVRGK